ncbi:MAG: hypothetical protein IPJ26_08975 [Bacteroidetes bacterium]|nr:hypothetical protein [Bacteroidota bacterium]
MRLTNYVLDEDENEVPVDMIKADFKNCIIYGNNDNELELDLVSGALKNHYFQNCIIKADINTQTSDPNHFNVIYRNNNPQFKNTFDNDLTLDTLAFAREKGDFSLINQSALPPMNIDIKGLTRPTGGTQPDLGAFERD